MTKELVGQDLGSIGHASVALEGGKIIGKIEVDAVKVIQDAFAKAKATIPGPYDDAILSGVEAYLVGAIKGV